MIFYTPFMINWLVATTVTIHVSHLFLQTTAMILIPYCLSTLMTKFLPQNGMGAVRRVSEFITPSVLFLIISLSISGAALDISWN
jgi:predicted Na+-dependent transporter